MNNTKRNDVEEVYNKAQTFYENGDFQQALALFQQISDACPDFSVLNYIGCCYLGMKHYRAAERTFKEVIAKAPDWERPYFNLARVYMETGRDYEAYLRLTTAIKINPSEEDAQFYMGVYYKKNRQWNEAIDCFLKAVKLYSEQADVHNNLSVCYAKTGDYEKALLHAEKALCIDPMDTDALFNVSKILINLKEYEKAFDCLYRKRASFGDDVDLLKNLLTAAMQTDHVEISLETAKRILEIDENNPLATQLLADFDAGSE